MVRNGSTVDDLDPPPHHKRPLMTPSGNDPHTMANYRELAPKKAYLSHGISCGNPAMLIPPQKMAYFQQWRGLAGRSHRQKKAVFYNIYKGVYPVRDLNTVVIHGRLLPWVATHV